MGGAHGPRLGRSAGRGGKADLIAFGRPYIANPDLPERFAAGVELAESNMETWYAGELGAEGYTDYPPHGS
jgi:N-ethylmaleimide reductase